MKYAWIDLETTGLNPRHDGAAILEVYVRITDTRLKKLDEFHALINRSGHIEFENDYVENMHRENGLLAELQHHETVKLGKVEKALCEFLKRNNDGDPRSLYLAGSSLKFDWAWLEVHMPDVLKHVHYRVADVSSTRVQMTAITGEDWEYKKEKGHRAARDVDETIAEYRFLWKKFMDWTAGVDFVDVWELPKL